MVADVAGYSRLMAADEAATILALKGHLEICETLIERHDGRIVDTAGDGFLATFPNASAAITCATTIQRRIAAVNADQPQNRRMLFRIGMNCADIVIDADQIFGDGVNLTARLERLADPGGICISEEARAAFEGVPDLGFHDLGRCGSPNGDQPIHAYLVSWPDGPTPGRWLLSRRRHRRLISVTGLVAALGIAALGLHEFLSKSYLGPAGRGEVGQAEGRDDPEPSIVEPGFSFRAVIRPFTAPSGEPILAAYGDRFASTLGRTLMEMKGAYVVSYAIASFYRGRGASVRDVADDLAIRYVIDGRVEAARDGERVVIRITDAATGEVSWSQTVEPFSPGGLAIAESIGQEISDRFELYPRARSESFVQEGAEPTTAATSLAREALHLLMFGSSNPKSHELAGGMLHRALTIDPENPAAWLGMSHWHNRRAGRSDQISGGPNSSALSLFTVQRAADLNPSSPRVRHMLAVALRFRGNHDRSMAEARKILEDKPYYPPAHYDIGYALLLKGETEAAIQHFDQAILYDRRSSGRMPSMYRTHLAFAQLMLGDREGALASAREAVEKYAKSPRGQVVLAALSAQDGPTDESRAALDALRRLRPDLAAVSKWRGMFAPSNDPVFNAKRDQLLDGLRKAGLPEK